MTQRKVRIPLTWVKHLKSEEEQRDFENLLRNTTTVLSRFRDLLEELENSKEVSFDDYDSPSWSHKQAHSNGYKEALRKVKDLIKFIPN